MPLQKPGQLLPLLRPVVRVSSSDSSDPAEFAPKSDSLSLSRETSVTSEEGSSGSAYSMPLPDRACRYSDAKSSSITPKTYSLPAIEPRSFLKTPPKKVKASPLVREKVEYRFPYRWDEEDVLADGTRSAKVVRATGVMGERVAIKLIPKPQENTFAACFEMKAHCEEAHLLSAISHPNVVRYIDLLETAECFCLVMDLVDGGDLIDAIRGSERGVLEEAESRRLFVQMAWAVRACHEKNITHRDIKPGNFLIDRHGNIQLIDFGHACRVGMADTKLQGRLGTPNFMAPEVLGVMNSKGIIRDVMPRTDPSYKGPPVDVWGLGVSLYAMMTGRPFVAGADLSEVFANLKEYCLNPEKKFEGLVRGPCLELIKGMLNPNPAHRLTLAQALLHPWLKEGASKAAIAAAFGSL